MRSTRDSTKMRDIKLLLQCHCYNLKQLYMTCLTAIEGKLCSSCITLKILLITIFLMYT